MNLKFSSKRLWLTGFIVSLSTYFLMQCNKTSDEFRITKAEFAGQIVSGTTPETAQPQDLKIWWKGNVKLPLKISFYMVTADKSGDYQKAEMEIRDTHSPTVLKDFYKFYGFNSPGNVVYELALEDQDAKKTEPYKMNIHINTN
jgi:hypothetical protein